MIEHNVDHAADFVRKGQQETRLAVRYQRTGRKVRYAMYTVSVYTIVCVCVFLYIIMVELLYQDTSALRTPL